VPAGPAPLETGVAQPVPSHWYQTESDAACTQVRGGSAAPSVADWHQPYACAQPADDDFATHMPPLHSYHFASLAA
jgi:hypothetical protein